MPRVNYKIYATAWYVCGEARFGKLRQGWHDAIGRNWKGFSSGEVCKAV